MFAEAEKQNEEKLNVWRSEGRREREAEAGQQAEMAQTACLKVRKTI